MLTQAARDQIRLLGGSLRLWLEAGGCCGTTYAFGLEGSEADLEFQDRDVTLFCTPEAVTLLTGAKLDYGVRLKPPRFRILSNPNTPQRCACNRSFGQKFPGKVTSACRAYCRMPWDEF